MKAGMILIVAISLLYSPGLRGEEAPRGKPVVLRARPFDLKQVRLLEGPFAEAMERDRRYLHDLESDRLLHAFRVNAGLAGAGRADGRLGAAGSPRPHHGPLPLGLRADVRQHGRREAQGQGRRDRRRTGQVPGGARRQAAT